MRALEEVTRIRVVVNRTGGTRDDHVFIRLIVKIPLSNERCHEENKARIKEAFNVSSTLYEFKRARRI